MKRVRTAIAAAVAVLLTLSACTDGQVRRGDRNEEQGYISGAGTITVTPVNDREPAPEFSAPLLGEDGDFHLSDHVGEVMVVNVWGSWCPPCRKEAPDLQAAYQDVKNAGVLFVGVNTRDDETNALAYIDEFGITYPNVDDTKGEALLAFRDTLPPSAIPSIVVIDSDGRVAARVLGAITKGSLKDLISDVIGKDGAKEEASAS